MYGVFIFRYDKVVYHISTDDKAVLCGRDIGDAEYIGEIDTAQDTARVSGRCCKLCQRKAIKNRAISDAVEAGD